MHKKVLVLGILFLAVFLSGCPDDSQTGYAGSRKRKKYS